MIKQNDRQTDLFCYSQSNHIAITQNNGEIRPCCWFIDRELDFYWDNFYTDKLKSLNNIHRSYAWFDLRERLVEQGNTFSGCRNCWEAERMGYISKRLYYNDICRQNGWTGELELEDLELSLDNKCNFMCRICRPGQSSVWNSAISKLPELFDLDRNHYQDFTENQKRHDHIVNLLENTDLSKLKRIALVGGEPFLSFRFFWFLQLVEKYCNLSDITMRINTNCSIYPSKERMKILKKMKKVYLDVSIDATGSLFEVIRNGRPWKLVHNTLKKFIEETDFEIKIHPTISVMNINKVNDVVSFAEDMGIKIVPAQLQFPEFLRQNMIPLEIRKNWTIPDNGEKFDIDVFNSIHTVDYRNQFNNVILNDHQSVNLMDEFVKSMNILDDYQGKKFKDVNPEIWEIVNDLKISQDVHRIVEKHQGKLSEIKKDKTFKIYDENLKDVSFLYDMADLEELYLCNCNIETFCLRYLKKLKKLDIGYNKITDLSSLDVLQDLYWLSMGGNKVSDFSPILDKNIKYLWIHNNPVKNISQFENFKELQVLSIDSIDLKDPENISMFENLIELDCNDNNIENLNFLKKLKNLRSLNLDNNNISDISQISKLKNLEALSLINNNVEDISSLFKLKKLKFLRIQEGNNITNYGKVKDMKLTKCDIIDNSGYQNYFDDSVCYDIHEFIS